MWKHLSCDREKLNPFILSVSAVIATHPFHPAEFNDDDPFVTEILKTGIRII